MTKVAKKLKIRKLIRYCVICSKKLRITVYPNRKYKGGNFFFKEKVKGRIAEYWECKDCYGMGSF